MLRGEAQGECWMLDCSSEIKNLIKFIKMKTTTDLEYRKRNRKRKTEKQRCCVRMYTYVLVGMTPAMWKERLQGKAI